MITLLWAFRVFNTSISAKKNFLPTSEASSKQRHIWLHTTDNQELHTSKIIPKTQHWCLMYLAFSWWPHGGHQCCLSASSFFPSRLHSMTLLRSDPSDVRLSWVFPSTGLTVCTDPANTTRENQFSEHIPTIHHAVKCPSNLNFLCFTKDGDLSQNRLWRSLSGKNGTCT